ncbi:LYR motif-containing protein 1 isoform X2 [Peromyscus leucopus]|uniref:LYR motif-containing protein 1 isoform X2 n=1 Tax=Peromyscus leucopus TaxID=10041 RepID=UPI0018854276|nr:LYR motif-containing protein 1 isoform X2 [Peromyscus leucopus]
MLPQRSAPVVWPGLAYRTCWMELGVAKARQSSWHRLLPAGSCGWGKAGLTQTFPPPLPEGLKMTTATRQEVLGLYRSIFRLARKWRAASGQMEDTVKEKQYILSEARTLFQKNKNLTDPDLIKQCIDECTARIEIGLHYQIPYPRPIHLPPMALTPLRGRRLQSQEKLRKLSKPVYLQSHDEVS